ncbi:MAG TPA: dephospho-CoA kinase [Pyrinomonadaceae bacterium]|nr:dephospho-CoA kinase [Pyrinomonadaceae bacterium]
MWKVDDKLKVYRTSEMLRVGLTGSIAVGKSYVSSVFAELGCHVLDADQTAREVVEPGSEGLKAVVAHFGSAVLTDDGRLDRQRLGDLIFADAQQRQRLNSILHPFIIARQDEVMREWEQLDPNGVGIIDAALMIESGGYKRFDKLIVVHCRPEVQLERLMLRTDLSLAEAQQRISSQMSQEEKQRYADYLIDTSDGFESTRQRTVEVYQKLREIRRAL